MSFEGPLSGFWFAKITCNSLRVSYITPNPNLGNLGDSTCFLTLPLWPCWVIRIFFQVSGALFTTHMHPGFQWVCSNGLQAFWDAVTLKKIKELCFSLLFSLINECWPFYDPLLERECDFLLVSFPSKIFGEYKKKVVSEYVRLLLIDSKL